MNVNLKKPLRISAGSAWMVSPVRMTPHVAAFEEGCLRTFTYCPSGTMQVNVSARAESVIRSMSARLSAKVKRRKNCLLYVIRKYPSCNVQAVIGTSYEGHLLYMRCVIKQDRIRQNRKNYALSNAKRQSLTGEKSVNGMSPQAARTNASTLGESME